MITATTVAELRDVLSAERRAGGTNRDLGLFIEDDWTLGALVLTAVGAP
jgi:hypothetical protein